MDGRHTCSVLGPLGALASRTHTVGTKTSGGVHSHTKRALEASRIAPFHIRSNVQCSRRFVKRVMKDVLIIWQ